MRRLLLALGALVLLALSVTGCAFQGQQQELPPGPLASTHPHAYLVPLRSGEKFTDSFEVLELGGKRPATITRVASVGGGPGLRQLGAYLAPPERRLTIQGMPGFPPDNPQLGRLIPAVGARILPVAETAHGNGYELLIGYRFRGDKIATRTQIRVSYTVGGRAYQSTRPAFLVVCPPAQGKRCEARLNGIDLSR